MYQKRIIKLREAPLVAGSFTVPDKDRDIVQGRNALWRMNMSTNCLYV
jgi:hypothetical protein